MFRDVETASGELGSNVTVIMSCGFTYNTNRRNIKTAIC